MTRRYLGLFLGIVFLAGCTTAMPIQSGGLGQSIAQILEAHIKVNKSMEDDVRMLLGEPQIISRYEESSFEKQILSIPLFEQLTSSFRSDTAPYVAWTYIQPMNEKEVQMKRTIKVLGVDVYSKDIRIANIFFNKKGSVVGYNISSHAIQ